MQLSTAAMTRILVADDDPELLQLVVNALLVRGFEVVSATTGGELLEGIAEDGPFHLVITDVAMPWMTGLQVMHSARSAGLSCPVIVMTAMRSHKTAEQVAALGVEVQLLYKPFTIDDLDRAVRRALGTRASSTETEHRDAKKFT
jgi:two-component system KDP operon response regulator KdpE